MVKHKKNQTKKKKGGQLSQSIKILRKTLDSLYDNDSRKNVKIKQLVNQICDNKNTKSNVQKTLFEQQLSYNGVINMPKNKQILIELAKKIGINNEDDDLEQLSDQELCQKLQYHHYPQTSRFNPFTLRNYLTDIKKSLVNDSFRAGSFIKTIKKSIEDIILKNDIVYNSVFQDNHHITMRQKAMWLAKGTKIIEKLEKIKLEIKAVLDQGGSTFWSDLFYFKPRVTSKNFVGKLSSLQVKDLRDLYDIITFNLNKTKDYLIQLEQVDSIRKEVKDIQKEQISQQRLDIDQKRNKREVRQHEWKREEVFDRYDEKYTKMGSNFLKALDLIQERLGDQQLTLTENLAKQVLKVYKKDPNQFEKEGKLSIPKMSDSLLQNLPTFSTLKNLSTLFI